VFVIVPRERTGIVGIVLHEDVFFNNDQFRVIDVQKKKKKKKLYKLIE
jgi:hypothetical protein